MKNVSKLINFDHAAGTPIRSEVIQAMQETAFEVGGNPNSIHAAGRTARAAVDRAREIVAKQLFACSPAEVVFTSGGTESNNLAVWGVIRSARKPVHVVSQVTEHVSVLQPLKAAERLGLARVTWLPVDQDGSVDPAALEKVVAADTALVSIMMANNEIGTIQDIPALVAAVKKKNPRSLFHTDASQAVGILDVHVQQLGVDLLTCTGNKIYGPHSGVLYIKKGASLSPLMYGGEQEHTIRPGTEAVPEIVGLGVAVELALKERAKFVPRLQQLRDSLWTQLQQTLPDVQLTGHPTQRLPHNLHINLPDILGETLLMRLDEAGILVSTGSACSAGSIQESHVVQALGLPKNRIRGSLRLTLGRGTTQQEVDTVAQILPRIISQIHA